MYNSRQLTMQKSIRYFFSALFWIPVVFFSLLLVRNTLPYFSFSQNFSFIEERAILFLKPVYKASFYLHIFAGMFCITAALTQFSSYILKKRKAIHIYMGKIYVLVVLLIGAPTGLYMSFFGSINKEIVKLFLNNLTQCVGPYTYKLHRARVKWLTCGGLRVDVGIV